MIKCPICSDLLEELTSVHCMKSHGIPKHQVIATYGKPKCIFVIYSRKHDVQLNPVIHPRDFLDSQQVTSHLTRKNSQA